MSRAVSAMHVSWNVTGIIGIFAALLLTGCGGGGTAMQALTRTLVVKAGEGGAVTSHPAGINCNADCREAYVEHTSVTLVAIPALGFGFSGWSGGNCTGTGVCTVILDSDLTITATFATMEIATCANGGVVYDKDSSNGFGRQLAVNGDQVSSVTDIAFIPGSAIDFVVLDQDGYVDYFKDGCDRVNRVDVGDVAKGGIGVVYGGEQGLLNVEFHPDYATNHFVFFYHTSVGGTVNSVSRMSVAFEENSGFLKLSDPQRIIDFRKGVSAVAENHNGGGLIFAVDGALLASVGDGGSSADSAQDDKRLLGKVIRILPSVEANAGGYSIPDGNMFAASLAKCSNIAASNESACPEIIAKGLRNPFRMSRDGGMIYLGDVGSGIEEINSFPVTGNTANFGWPTHDGPVSSSLLSGYRNPIVSYGRNSATAIGFRAEDSTKPMATGAASVMIGGVYRGDKYTAYMNSGALLFDDFYDGYVRAVGVNATGDIVDSDNIPGIHLIHGGQITSMVQGPDGYIYLTGLYGPAMVYRLVYQAPQ
ncbi:MAG: PQQ-dependent sugar dehydrogenase [Pseudomonadota bacterium]